MKKYIKDKLYVQISDILHLLKYKESLSDELYNTLSTFAFSLHSRVNIFEFICLGECNDESIFSLKLPSYDISFISILDCFTKYDDYKDWTIEALKDEIEKLSYKISQNELICNNITDNIRSNMLAERNNKLVLQMTNLEGLYFYKQGLINYHIPGEKYERPLIIKRLKYIYKSKKKDE